MINFCTLFDANYLVRALAMYRSLQATGESFTLYAVCFDHPSYRILERLRLPELVAISLEEFETPALRAVKGERSAGEYCWTCTSQVIRYLLERYRLPELTYLDADLYFYQKPSLLLAELKGTGASVLINEHRYTPTGGYWDALKRGFYRNPLSYGVYCVQFITFKADANGLRVLNWWQERCLEWCYARLEDGKFGDQKYLDDWTVRFPGVHVLRHLGGGVAPWNVERYQLVADAGRLSVDGQQLVFYHFHRLHLYRQGLYDLGFYRLPAKVIDLLYRPYARALGEAQAEIRLVEPGFDQGYALQADGAAQRALNLVRRLFGTYNVCRLSQEGEAAGLGCGLSAAKETGD